MVDKSKFTFDWLCLRKQEKEKMPYHILNQFSLPNLPACKIKHMAETKMATSWIYSE